MNSKIFLISILLLASLSSFFLSQKFLLNSKASLIENSFFSKLEEISKEIEKLNSKIKDLEEKLEKLKNLSQEFENSNLKIQELKEESQKISKDLGDLSSKRIKIEKKENLKKPKILLSFPKEVFLNEEFSVSISISDLEEKIYDLKISVESENKTLSQIFDQKEKKWKDSNFYLKEAFEGPEFSGNFSLKIFENFFGEAEIFVKIRESETQKIVAEAFEKIKIKEIENQKESIPKAQAKVENQKEPISKAETQIECIDINSASAEELEKIYGVGPIIAQEIIKNRPFFTIDDLIKVKGIGEKKLQKIKEQGLACVK